MVNSLTQNPARRAFIKRAAASGFLVAFGDAFATTPSAHITPQATSLNGWISIAPGGTVTLLSNSSEIGQGTGTALAQILANELDLDWRTVKLAMAPVTSAFINPQWGEYATYGSGGVAGQFSALRQAAAKARSVLISAAATQWKVPAKECDTDSGAVVHVPSSRRLPYADLAQAAVQLPLPTEVPLMPRERWRYIGRDAVRFDIPAKVDGSAVYGIDVKRPGMLTATLLQSPSFGGRLAHVDPAPAMRVRGVRHVVKLDDAVAVVAESYWSAKKGLAALKPTWDNSQASKHNSADYAAALAAGVRDGGSVFARRDSSAEKEMAAFTEAMRSAQKSLEQLYTVPFLSHATMEPMNATARVGPHDAELWIPTQTQQATRDIVAKDLGLPTDAVTIHTTLAGGGFGRRAELDFPLQAVRIAKRTGATVKLIWSREEDMRHDFYRPAAAVRLSAGIGADGLPVAIRFDFACESLLVYSGGGASKANSKPVDPTAVGELPRHYKIPSLLPVVNTIDIGVPVGFWRSVASSQNCFAYECFVDELAHAANRDPAGYRRSLLAPDSRERRVLDEAIARSGWNDAAPAGNFRGLALIHANGSVVVHVVELSIADQRKVKLHRITTVVDCGVAINPRNIRAQMEGGVVFGLSATFYGEITIKDGAVEQSNFHDYPLVRLADVPMIDVSILESGERPGGVGEEAVGPVAPAVVNALFAATGRRITQMPLSKAGFTLA
jgi:isoquinoline 1-oxidoreductase subunit beta